MSRSSLTIIIIISSIFFLILSTNTTPSQPIPTSLFYPPDSVHVIRILHTPHGKPYDIHGLPTSIIVSGYTQWNYKSVDMYTALVYIDGIQYPVFSLFLGYLDDPSITPEILIERTRYWSNGLYYIRRTISSTELGIHNWLPMSDSGEIIDPTSWGWNG